MADFMKSVDEVIKAAGEIHGELCKLSDIAQKLDAFNPEIPGAFSGSVSDRIIRQLRFYKIPGFPEVRR